MFPKTNPFAKPPEVFYHGTTKTFTDFKGVTFVTTNPKEAEKFARGGAWKGEAEPYPDGARIIRLTTKGKYLTLGSKEAQQLEAKFGALGSGRSVPPEVVKLLTKYGYAGIERVMPSGHKVRAIFSPSNIQPF